MHVRLLRRRSLKSSVVALVALIVLMVGGTTALAATADIEGVWSFKGGAIAIQSLSDGTFQGTVVTPTTFVECPHPAGEVLWTNLRRQSDGSYWGFHQWFKGPKCEVVPELGLTAWRVLVNGAGARFVRVCFSDPGSKSQPTIAPDGSSAGATFAGFPHGCTDSALISPLPTVSSNEGSGNGPGQITFHNTVVLPNAKACVSQTSLKIKLHHPKYDPLKEVVVRIKGKKVADVKGVKRLKKGVTLKKLPSGTYKISVLAITVLNQRLFGSRTYHSCTKSSGIIKLHGGK